ncbi:hypothetical protein B4U80_07903 [Leptotrombidium deliense]|uniref:PH domain-containing protein n=1 Tax=Leptotrombidium deliense TaxID=299467 RepID=A0A443SPF3_9ACAR|nr:hypothetical protein B4U80_07903 [Leptotrombidium deliense]
MSTNQEESTNRTAIEHENESIRPSSTREVLKCGFLRLKCTKIAPNPKNGDKYWVIFYVKNECDPILDFYNDRQPVNKPTGTVVLTHSLKQCIHVSPSIVIDERDDNFEFAITLDANTVRLCAPSQDLMDDWIDCIRNKLRQLKILSPKDNYYSKEPSFMWRRRSLPSVRPLPPIPSQNIDIQMNTPPQTTASANEPLTTETSPNSLYEPLYNSRRDTLPAAIRGHSSIDILPLQSRDSSRNTEFISFNSLSTSQQQSQPLSLRESQVLKLQTEISHKDGVRVMIRKKDSYESIALVNCFGAVFVAGWKQKQYPQLHNTFHIGDSVISICGQKVSSANEAYKMMKQQSLVIEIVLQRVPLGKVFIMKREFDSQELGITRNGNSAEVIDVVPDSLADKCGLGPKATPIDPKNGTECNWIITEINNRPLNLFFKGNEVRDRLNAVGKDISLLVQPVDLIKALKKELKTFKNHKDYVVQ